MASRSLALLQGLMAPQLAGDEPTFEDRLLNWEDQSESYQEQAGKEFPDEVKQAVLSAQAPQTVREHIHLNAANISTYAAMRESVTSFLKACLLYTSDAADDM
eukprot:14864030-Alexandrium_andersonii.AAC.1